MQTTAHIPERCVRLQQSIEIAADPERVFSHWTRYEDFPRFMESVRRTKRIDERNVLWDVDVATRQIVWEARIVEQIDARLIRWYSTRGTPNRGEVRFEARPGGCTRLSVDIAYQPRGWLERVGARLGLVERSVQRDLARFRSFVESSRPEFEAAREAHGTA